MLLMEQILHGALCIWHALILLKMKIMPRGFFLFLLYASVKTIYILYYTYICNFFKCATMLKYI